MVEPIMVPLAFCLWHLLMWTWLCEKPVRFWRHVKCLLLHSMNKQNIRDGALSRVRRKNMFICRKTIPEGWPLKHNWVQFSCVYVQKQMTSRSPQADQQHNWRPDWENTTVARTINNWATISNYCIQQQWQNTAHTQSHINRFTIHWRCSRFDFK